MTSRLPVGPESCRQPYPSAAGTKWDKLRQRSAAVPLAGPPQAAQGYEQREDTQQERKHGSVGTVHQLLQPAAAQDTERTRRNIVFAEDLGHFDKQLGNHHDPCGLKTSNSNCSSISGTGTSSNGAAAMGDVDILVHGVPLDPLLRPDLGQAGSGEECFRNFAVYCVSYSSTRPLPSSDLVTYGAGTRQGP